MRSCLLLVISALVLGLAHGQPQRNRRQFPSIPTAKFPQANLPPALTPNFPKLNLDDIPLAANVSNFNDQIIGQLWGVFTKAFGKLYKSPTEEKERQNIFTENYKKIGQLNQQYQKDFVQKLNQFSDLLNSEFNTLLNGFNKKGRSSGQKGVPKDKGQQFVSTDKKTVPDSIDWRKLGAVTPVKSQGLCAGCYAFSAAGAIEGHWFKKTGELKELSPQNLIDCTAEYGNDGCQGGLMTPAFEYIQKNKGIATSSAYPYDAENKECRYKAEGQGIENKGYVDIPEGDEEALKNAVGTLGPVAAAMDASRESFQFYSDGVYYDKECKNAVEDMNHAVLVVGYGTDPDGKEYWLVKNSYGPKWGKDGYFKLERNKGNHCGIANIASFPLV